MNRAATLALIVLVGSLLALFVASARTTVGPASSDYAALVNQAEDSLRTLAHGGVSALARPEARSGLEQLTKRPLAPLLSAWSALSLGRMGLVSGSSSVRMPWLILAGFMPASVFVLLRPRWPARAAFGAAFWLLMSPGFVANALSVRPSVLAVWSGWLVLVAYACVARERAWRVRCALLVACTVLAWLAFGLSFAALWVVPLLLLHAWGSHGSISLRALRRGHVPVPAAALLVVAALPVAVIAFDPLLWHADVPALIRRVFDEEDPVHGSAPLLAPFVLPCILALAGLAELSRSALARRFATGEFRPRRDPSALGLLLALGLGLVALLLGIEYRPELGICVRAAATDFGVLGRDRCRVARVPGVCTQAWRCGARRGGLPVSGAARSLARSRRRAALGSGAVASGHESALRLATGALWNARPESVEARFYEASSELEEVERRGCLPVGLVVFTE